MRCMAGEKHKIGLTLFVIAALLAGCSAAPTLEPATSGAPPGETRPAAAVTMPAATPTTEAVKPGGIKVNPPKLPVEPGPGTLPAGWQTYTSPDLGVALDYPKDWPVTETGAGASIT